MEGPSLYLATQQHAVLRGKTVEVVTGSTKLGGRKYQFVKIIS